VERKISKFLSGLLRHFPQSFGIELNSYGWANFERVVEIVAKRYGMDKEDAKRTIEKIVKEDPKGRFELKNGKIRAKYGHSVDVEIKWSESKEIPPILYHGTSRKAINSIVKEGLLPMKRKEVHLSKSFVEALEVGRRYDNKPVVLKIDAKKMIEDGYEIRKKGKVYTTDYVPPKYIKF